MVPGVQGSQVTSNLILEHGFVSCRVHHGLLCDLLDYEIIFVA